VKPLADALGVARSNLAARLSGEPPRRRGRPPASEDELLAAIRAVIAEMPTYGYRRVHALLRRQAEAEGRAPPNHKRVYRIMKTHDLLLQRHAGGSERRHEGRIAVAERNRRPRRSADRRCFAGGSSACCG
jgi:putative transposase